MFKKVFISTILLFVFSFVLVHNISPHHHHEEIPGIAHPHHDKHDDQDHDKGLLCFFKHLCHIDIPCKYSFNN